MSEKIHPTAVVDPGAEIGKDVVIGPYSVIAEKVRIGDGCRIAPHVVIHSHTTLGAGCEVHSGAVIGDTPQDIAFKGGESFVEIGSNCVLREGVTIHRGTKEGTTTRLGDGCFLMAFSHCAHNVQLGDRVILVNGALLAGYVTVGDGAFISGNAVVHQFCHIGRLAMLGGMSGIGKDVPPFCTTESAVRNRVAGLNIVGMRRAGIGGDERKEIKRAFTLLYRSDLSPKQACEQIRKEFSSGPALEFCDFVEASERGIVPHRGGSED